jgi:putative drug exporter of the RND superfamily
MFTTLGTFAARRHRVILIFTALFIAAGFVLGVGVFGNLKSGGFDNPSSGSSRARAVLVNEFNAADANVVLLVTAASGSVDDPAVAAAGTALTTQLGTHPGVSHVAGYWTLGNAPPLRSKDGTKAIVVARVDGTDAAADTTFHELKTLFEGNRGPITVGFGGEAAINADLGRAEGLAIPLTIVLLILVFGGLVAASLPLFVAIIAVPGTLLSLLVISQVTDVSIYSINLTTALGLGLAIDYSLFIVNRFREELDNGLSVEAAVIRTVETAGRTVAFSALTVAGSLVALLAFPLYFLRSFAYAGTSVVLIAAAGALVSLPALLSVVGLRINSLRIFRRRSTKATSEGFWHRLASVVMKRPVPIAAAVIGVLILLGLPFFRASFGLPGYETLPESSKARTVSAQLVRDFEGNTAGSFAAVVTGVDPTTVLPQLNAYAAHVSGLAGVARVSGLTGTYVRGALVAPAGEEAVGYQRRSTRNRPKGSSW